MGQGRGSAFVTATAVVATVAIVAVFHCGVADATTYTVGGTGGWTFNTASWPNGKSFKAGDVLVFNYNPAIHNVVAVTAAGCTAGGGAKVYRSGRDRITLARGRNFFICTFPGHCQFGMQIAITAT